VPRATETSRRQRHEDHQGHKDHNGKTYSLFVIFVVLVVFVSLPSARFSPSRYRPGEKQYSRPAPPVEIRFCWLQPRLACTEFHDALGPPRRS